jgi:hypothetical protein
MFQTLILLICPQPSHAILAYALQKWSSGQAPVTHPSRCLAAAKKTTPLFGDDMCCPSCYIPLVHSWRTKLSCPAVPLVHLVGHELRTEWRAGTEQSTTFFSLPLTTLSNVSLPNLFHIACAAVIATRSGTTGAAVTARPFALLLRYTSLPVVCLYT